MEGATLNTDLKTKPVLRRDAEMHLTSLTTIVLMPHSRCNCRCVMCDIWKANRELDELSAAAIEKHRDDFSSLGVKEVILTGGEPLMHENLWRICTMFRELGIRITVMSSGLLLEEHAENLVAHCDEIVVPIEGDAAIHNRIREVPRAHERMCEGVRALRKIDPDQVITAQAVIQRMNFAYLLDMIRCAEDLNLDGIRLKAVDVDSSAFNRMDRWSDARKEDMRLRAVDVIILGKMIDQIRDELPEHLETGFITGGTKSLDSLLESFESLADTTAPVERKCTVPWNALTIEATGLVKPCPFHESVGNIRKTPLSEILNSETALAFRQDLDVASDPVCRGCSSSRVY